MESNTDLRLEQSKRYTFSIYFSEILIAPFVRTAHLRPPAWRPCLPVELASNVVTFVDSVTVFLGAALVNASFALRHKEILLEARDVLVNAK